jgi:transposase
MKSKKEATTRTVRSKYTASFKEQALERADKDGIPKVAQDLGLAEATLYAWRAKRRQTGQPFEEQKLQQAELARLNRENARPEDGVASLKKAAAYPSASSGQALRNCPSEVRRSSPTKMIFQCA